MWVRQHPAHGNEDFFQAFLHDAVGCILPGSSLSDQWKYRSIPAPYSVEFILCRAFCTSRLASKNDFTYYFFNLTFFIG
jgi:hypothetical protein